MQMQASRSLAVRPRQAWVALNDPDTLRACLAGCDRFEALGEGRYAVAMAVKVGPVSARFSGEVTLCDSVAPERCRIAFEVQDERAGFGKGSVEVRLSPEPGEAGAPPGCLLACSVQAQVGGEIARLGPSLIDGAAQTLADDFFARFDALMQQRHPRMPPTAADEAGHIEPTVDTQAWEHDAAAGIAMPLDAAPATEAEVRARRAIPLWCWALAVAVVLGAGWVLSHY